MRLRDMCVLLRLAGKGKMMTALASGKDIELATLVSSAFSAALIFEKLG